MTSPELRPDHLGTARTPRMLGLLVLLLAVAAVCGRLGMWQLDRAADRAQARADQAAREAAQAEPVPLAEVLEPGEPVTAEMVAVAVAVSGELTEQVLVVGRARDGEPGVLVLAGLRVEGDGALLPVVRGWVPDAAAAESLEPPPAGSVEVTGWIQVGEAGGEARDLPPGTVDAISPAELVNLWGGPMYSGYLVLSGVEPAQDAALLSLGPPTATSDGPVLQNLAYALQWWIFGGFAVLLWVRMVRDEARASAEQAAEHPAAAGDAEGQEQTAVGRAEGPTGAAQVSR